MYKLDIYKYQSKKFNSLIALFFEKSLCNDKNVMLFCDDEKKLKLIDKLLWEYNPSSWIPHLMVDDIYSEKSKIILSSDIKNNTNQAQILCIIDTIIDNTEYIKDIDRIVYFIPNNSQHYNDSINILKNTSSTINTYIQQLTGKWVKEDV